MGRSTPRTRVRRDGGTHRGGQAIVGVVKVVAILLGLLLTIFSLMSLAGLGSDHLWVRLAAAVAVGVGVPWLVAGRLTRDDPGSSTPRFVSVLSVCWLGFGVAFVAGAFPWTQPLLVDETERLARAEIPAATAVAGWVARELPAEERGAAEAAAEQRRARPRGTRAKLPPESSRSSEARQAVPTADADGGPEAQDDTVSGADGGVDAATAELERPELSIPELVVAVEDFLVTVSVLAGDRERSGAGFVVGRDRVVTCSRLVEGADSVAIRLGDGSWLRRTTLVAADPRGGIALLGARGAGRGAPAAEEVSEEAELFALGSPLGLEPAVTASRLAPPAAAGGGAPRRLASRVARGALCGPVVTRRGEVVGLALPSEAVGGSPIASMSAIEELVAAAGGHPVPLGRAGVEARTW